MKLTTLSVFALLAAGCGSSQPADRSPAPVASASAAPASHVQARFASDGTPPVPTTAPTTTPPSTPTAAPATTAKPEPDPDPKPVRAAIMKTLESHFADFRKCYDERAERNAHGGRASFRFVVAPSGEVVTLADEGSTLEDKAVVACIGRAISAIKFTPWNGKAVTMVLPIDFQPNTF